MFNEAQWLEPEEEPWEYTPKEEAEITIELAQREVRALVRELAKQKFDKEAIDLIVDSLCETLYVSF